MKNRIDLHIHSSYSDGFLSPKEIIDIAKQNKTSTISISDHDTIEAYNDELFKYAKDNQIVLIPAVEMSTKFYSVGIHVLGYNIDLNNKQLLDCLSSLKNARLNYLENVTKCLNQLGYIVNINELKQLPTVTKAHIALDVINNKNNHDLLIKTFNHIPNKGEFIETIMNEGCPAYVEKFSISPIEASKIIKQANGKVILAHPIAYMHEDNLSVEQIGKLIKEMNADGIEANYLYIDKNNNEFNDSTFWNNYAKENDLIVTIGSDFHNFDIIHPQIGFINKNLKLSKEEANNILNNLSN